MSAIAHGKHAEKAYSTLAEETYDLSTAITAAQDGDEAAFRRLYRAMQPLLLRYLSVLVGGDAEDVASEAWLQVARDLASFRGDDDGFRGWVTTIARHRAMDHLRKQQRRPVSTVAADVLLDFAALENTAEAACEAISTSRAIAFIATLPRDQAEAILLRVIIGVDAKTAGQIMGKRPGTIRNAAYKGLRKLAEILQR